MLGCSYGSLFQVAVAGGSYQDGLTVHMQGVPTGQKITEDVIYSSLLLRKPGQGELASAHRRSVSATPTPRSPAEAPGWGA